MSKTKPDAPAAPEQGSAPVTYRCRFLKGGVFDSAGMKHKLDSIDTLPEADAKLLFAAKQVQVIPDGNGWL